MALKHVIEVPSDPGSDERDLPPLPVSLFDAHAEGCVREVHHGIKVGLAHHADLLCVHRSERIRRKFHSWGAFSPPGVPTSAAADVLSSSGAVTLQPR
jgi:hypothetical protein